MNYFTDQSWYKPQIENVNNIALNPIEEKNINLIKELEKNALPEWIEDKIINNFEELSFIEAALKIEYNDNTYWVVSLVPKKMELQYSEKFHIIKKAQKFLTDDEILELLDVTGSSLDQYLDYQTH